MNGLHKLYAIRILFACHQLLWKSGLFEDERLIAHWTLDETEGDVAFDSVGINDGYVTGNPPWQPDGGQIGGALQLDGVDDFLATDFVLDPSEGPFSVFAWIQGGVAGQVIVSQVDGENWLGTDPTHGWLMTDLEGAGRGSSGLGSEVVVTDGSWHRVGLVWDGENRTLYVDDAVVAEDTQAGGLVGGSGDLNIGCGKDMATGTFFWGLIDDVRIYNRVIAP